ncbi:hypothetical protein [uncultured Polaribacter sp.]|uniref:hypothetical protein n=1 Tax=uncultured Polaribacter sp. TaxID=174711 RepID=UPI002611289D|nr:hypothetical protein [uncultured Polaribacter sp.]
MKTNKIDQEIKEKLANRTFATSASAWDRLSAQLDEEPKQKKKAWFYYAGYAAGILLLIYVGFSVFSDDNMQGKPVKEIIVNNPIVIDTFTVKNKIDEIFTEIKEEKVIVAKDVLEEGKETSVSGKETIDKRQETRLNKLANIESRTKEKINFTSNAISKNEKLEKDTLTKENIVIAKVDKKMQQISTEKKEDNITIKVNGADLLYAVTHTNQEVKAYYAKHNITRDQVLKTIKSELKKSNLEVDPETILAEVENTISEDVFNNNFLKSLKRRVTDIASAIASRNE